MSSFENVTVTCIDKTRLYGINSDDKGEYYTGRKSIHEKVFKHESSLLIDWVIDLAAVSLPALAPAGSIKRTRSSKTTLNVLQINTITI